VVERLARGEDPLPFYQDAIKNLDDAVARDPDSFMAHLDRGNAIMMVARRKLDRGEQVGDLHERAIADYGEAIRVRPTTPTPGCAAASPGPRRRTPAT